MSYARVWQSAVQQLQEFQGLTDKHRQHVRAGNLEAADAVSASGSSLFASIRSQIDSTMCRRASNAECRDIVSKLKVGSGCCCCERQH
jgi:hypothetical protein